MLLRGGEVAEVGKVVPEPVPNTVQSVCSINGADDPLIAQQLPSAEPVPMPLMIAARHQLLRLVSYTWWSISLR